MYIMDGWETWKVIKTPDGKWSIYKPNESTYMQHKKKQAWKDWMEFDRSIIRQDCRNFYDWIKILYDAHISRDKI